MKKILFVSAFFCVSLIASAKNTETVTPSFSQASQSESAGLSGDENAVAKEDGIKYNDVAIHISGTMTSSCGVRWHYTYDCYSECTFGGTLANMVTMQQSIDNACGTTIATIDLTFD